MTTDPRRTIPSVDRLLASSAFTALLDRMPRSLVVLALQDVQQRVRQTLSSGRNAPADLTTPEWYAAQTEAELTRVRQPSLQPLINATGVILHTNLGRAPLAEAALHAIEQVARGYSNLEYDTERGSRGSRHDHCRRLLTRITGAEDALIVNNNAAALVLALNTLAEGRAAVISRGELVEIGGSFRIPDIMARSGATMVEVGTTNRTNSDDYRNAITERTGAILKVHPSNFRVTGFTAEVTLDDLAALSRERDVPIINDLGSGLLLESSTLGLPYEPTPMDALQHGANVVTMSADKLLGGPQGGIILGERKYIEAMRRNPLCRALRVDKLTIAALEATLALYLDPDKARREVPVLRMLTTPLEELSDHAERIAGRLRSAGLEASCIDGSSAVGGGAFPTLELPTRLVRVSRADLSATVLEQRLRKGNPVVIARIVDDHLVLDPRTVLRGEEERLIDAVRLAAERVAD